MCTRTETRRRRNEVSQEQVAPATPLYIVQQGGHKRVGDHFEFCLTVLHRLGASWQIQHRYTTLQQLHMQLTQELPERALPTFPEKSWWPSFTQSLDKDFLEERQHALTRYFNDALKDEVVATHPAMTQVLKIQRPESPKGFLVTNRRVVGSGFVDLEFEVRPSLSDTAPIDKYHVAMNFGHGEFAERSVPAGHHGVPFRTWLRGAPMGQHRFSVAAVNRAGRSQCVEVPVLASQEDAFRDVDSQWPQGSQPHDPRHIPEHHRMYGRPRHVVTNDAGHRFQDASWQVQSDTSLTGAQVAAEVAANRGFEHWHPSARDHQHAYNGQFGHDSRARHHRAGHQTDTQTVASATTFSGGGVTPGVATRHSSGAHGDHRAVASTMRLDTTRGLPLQPSWSQTSTRQLDISSRWSFNVGFRRPCVPALLLDVLSQLLTRRGSSDDMTVSVSHGCSKQCCMLVTVFGHDVSTQDLADVFFRCLGPRAQ